MIVDITHKCDNFDSFRANKVKSLFNASKAYEWKHKAELPIENDDWQIGLIVGPSGSGKSSIGERVFDRSIYDLYQGWDKTSQLLTVLRPRAILKQ